MRHKVGSRLKSVFTFPSYETVPIIRRPLFSVNSSGILHAALCLPCADCSPDVKSFGLLSSMATATGTRSGTLSAVPSDRVRSLSSGRHRSAGRRRSPARISEALSSNRAAPTKSVRSLSRSQLYQHVRLLQTSGGDWKITLESSRTCFLPLLTGPVSHCRQRLRWVGECLPLIGLPLIALVFAHVTPYAHVTP